MSLKTIIKENYNPLSATEERIYLESAKKGNLNARNTLINSILPLISSMASQLSQMCSLSKEDLFQAGYVGACKAVDAYDLSNKTQFSTFAMNRGLVMAEMQKEMRKNLLVDMPAKERQKHYRHSFMSFDAPLNDNEKTSTFAEVFADPNSLEQEPQNVICQRVSIESLLNHISNKGDREIVRACSEGLSTRKIGKLTNLSHQGVCNNRDRAIKEIQKFIKNSQLAEIV